MHGTTQIPAYRRNGPRIYNEEYNRMRKTVMLHCVQNFITTSYIIVIYVEFTLSLLHFFQYSMLEPNTNFIQNGYDRDVQLSRINDISWINNGGKSYDD